MTKQQAQTWGWQSIFNAALLTTTYLLGTTTRKFSSSVTNVGSGAVAAWTGLTVLQPVSAIGTVNLQSGLVAYYPFNGNANDESGNGHDGTVVGATLTLDRLGNANKAYYFDGNSHIDLSNPRFMDESCNATIAAWINDQSANDNSLHQIIASGDTRGCLEPITMQIFNGKPRDFGFEDTINNINSCSIIDNSEIPAFEKTWIFITLVLSTDEGGSTNLIYVNKNLIYSSAINPPACIRYDVDMPTQIGALYGIQTWIGSLDDIRVYNRSLNADEVLALYNEKATPTPTATATTSFTTTSTLTHSSTITATESNTDSSTNSNTISSTTTATNTQPTICTSLTLQNLKQTCHDMCVADGICNTNVSTHNKKNQPQEVEGKSDDDTPKQPSKQGNTNNGNKDKDYYETIKLAGMAGGLLGGVAGAVVATGTLIGFKLFQRKNKTIGTPISGDVTNIHECLPDEMEIAPALGYRLR